MKLIIIGAGSHANVIEELATSLGHEIIGCIDDTNNTTSFAKSGTKILGGFELLTELSNVEEYRFIIAFGDNYKRKRIADEYNLAFVSLVSKTADISPSAFIGQGTVVFSNVVINTNAYIGSNCIINSGSIVEHDCVIEDYVNVSPGVVLGGNVKIGLCCQLGINAAIRNNTNIASDVIIGMGSAVVKDIVEKGTYIGVPAEKRK